MSNDGSEIQFTVDSFKVSASEKISTGEYENYTPHASIEGSIEGVNKLNDEKRTAIQQRLLSLHRDLQRVLQKTCKNRLRIKDTED